MQVSKLHRGRLIDHLHIVTADLDASRKFYVAVFDALGIPLGASTPDHFWADELFVSSADSPAALGKLTGRHHLAFQAESREAVAAFHEAGLKAGGRDNGPPGERADYHPGYYAAFLIDPDGNNIEAVHHGPANRSATSVEVTF
jgi:catechol 2,3-dioxygenase-like lactoylglutathione lyase family enzyme